MSGRGSRKVDATGRSTTSYKPRKATVKLPSDQFLALPRNLLESPVMRVISAPALRALFRLCVEHLAHGGAENGNLCVTHQQFITVGVGRNTVKGALIELEALGLIEMVVQGGRSYGDTRLPSRFRLTFPQGRKCDPTHDWFAVRDEADALRRVAEAKAQWDGLRPARPARPFANGNAGRERAT